MAETDLQRLDAARWKRALTLTALMMVIYFAFVLLVAFHKPLMTGEVTPGLSLGMLLGALVIVAAWLLMWSYVRWANSHYDEAIARIRRSS